jgi:hypothetical protein
VCYVRTVVCLVGSAVVSVFGSGGKLAVFLLWRESFITTGKKKDTVVCLAGARSLLRPEKKDTVVCPNHTTLICT